MLLVQLMNPVIENQTSQNHHEGGFLLIKNENVKQGAHKPYQNINLIKKNLNSAQALDVTN